MAGAAVKHDYHLVNPSPWPLVGSAGAAIMAVGAVAWMQTDVGGLFGVSGPWLFLIGLGVVLYTMFGWWRDIVKESLSGESDTPVIRLGLRYGMILFIASEVMFFVAWFWSYFNTALFPGAMGGITLASGDPLLVDAAVGIGANEVFLEGAEAQMGNYARSLFTGDHWPPSGVETLSPWQLPLINTVILLLSGTTVTWAHHAVQHGDKEGVVQGLIITVLLGVFFSALQAFEYYEALHLDLFTFGGQIYGANFFMATGFHGAHVIIGTIFLFVCLLRAMQNHFTPERHFGFEAAAWYWHFVDVVWLFLFAVIYLTGTGFGAAAH
ncbi:MAG: cytochrome c oxidase subunit 3 [Pseudomonadota bacterium]